MNQPNNPFVRLTPEQLLDTKDHPPIVDGVQFYEDVKAGRGGPVRTTHLSLDNGQTGCYGVCTHSQVDQSDGSVFHRRGYLFVHGDGCACLVPGQPTHFSDRVPEYLEAHAAGLVAAGKICEKGFGLLVMELFLGLPVSEELGLRAGGSRVPEQAAEERTDEERTDEERTDEERTDEERTDEENASSGAGVEMEKEREDDTTGRHDEDEKQTTWLRLL